MAPDAASYIPGKSCTNLARDSEKAEHPSEFAKKAYLELSSTQQEGANGWMGESVRGRVWLIFVCAYANGFETGWTKLPHFNT